MMKVHPYQDYKKYKHSHMTCRACVKLSLYIYGIGSSIDAKMLIQSHDSLVHLEDLEYERNTDIGTLKKERGDIFSYCCTKNFKEKLQCYVNELLF